MKLIATKVPHAAPVDFTPELHNSRLLPDKLSSRWSLIPGPGRLTTVTIRNRESRVLLRSQTGSITTPAAPLVSTYTGGMEYGHVGWSLRTFSYPAGSREPPNLDKLVLAHAGSSRM